MGQDGLAGVHAFVIHDVSFTPQRLKRALQDIGIRNVHSASNVPVVCTMMENSEAQPDLVVTNFQMPDMKGVELLKRIPSNDISSLRPKVHFVILTGFL